MARIAFFLDGLSLAYIPGRARPGLPSYRIVDLATKPPRHVSLAFPESETAVLFDLNGGDGVRLDLVTREATRFPDKRAYWLARDAAGWGVRRRMAQVGGFP